MQEQEPRVLWQSDLSKRYNVNPSTVWRWSNGGQLPPPDIRIGCRKGWFVSTIESYERASVTPKAA